MTITRLLAALASVLVMAMSPARAEPLETGWVEGFNNRARLHAGSAEKRDSGRSLYAAVEITMPKGWKTYWRSVGEAGGIPPEFEWTGSENLSEARVFYPAPRRLADKAGEVVGYLERVVLPVALSPKDATLPVKLRAVVRYGVCKNLCVPAEVTLAIDIPPNAAPSSEIEGALSKVPADPKSGTDPSLAAWRLDKTSAKPRLILDVSSRDASASDAFVDVADGTFIPLPRRTSADGGKAQFEVDLSDGVDLKDLKGKDLHITLTDSSGQSETKIRLE